jgi:hypothetical protein
MLKVFPTKGPWFGKKIEVFVILESTFERSWMRADHRSITAPDTIKNSIKFFAQKRTWAASQTSRFARAPGPQNRVAPAFITVLIYGPKGQRNLAQALYLFSAVYPARRAMKAQPRVYPGIPFYCVLP